MEDDERTLKERPLPLEQWRTVFGQQSLRSNGLEKYLPYGDDFLKARTPQDFVDALRRREQEKSLTRSDVNHIVHILFSTAQGELTRANRILLHLYEAVSSAFGTDFVKLSGMSSLDEAYPNVNTAIERGLSIRNRLKGASDAVTRSWGGDYVGHPFFQRVWDRENFCKELQRFANAYPRPYIAFNRITRAMVRRLRTAAPGRSSSRDLQPADLKATEGQLAGIDLAHDDTLVWMRAQNMGQRADGLPYFNDRARTIVEGEQPRFDYSTPSPPAYSPLSPGVQPAHAQADALPPISEDQRRTWAQTAAALAAQDQESNLPRSHSGSPAVPYGSGSGEQRGSRRSAELELFRLRSGGSAGYGSDDAARAKSPTPGSCRSKTPGTAVDHPAAPTGCKCNDSVSTTLLATLNLRKTPNDIYTKIATNVEVVKITSPVYRSMCRFHFQQLLKGVYGLQVGRGTYAELSNRLTTVIKCVNDPATHGTLTALYGSKSSWFLRAVRPAVPSDTLGSYRFHPAKPPEELADIQKYNLDDPVIRKNLGITRGMYTMWKNTGTIIIPNLFAWWRTTGMSDIALSEFNMYRWHLREADGKHNNAWNRSMFYAITQQIMRQDPLYWLVYSMLRPDRAFRLVSYPYYAKYQHPSAGKNEANMSSEGFRHIDNNMKRMSMDGRGRNMIQGTLSLDDESSSDCTVMMDGMHHVFDQWVDALARKNLLKKGHVEAVTKEHLRASKDQQGLDYIPKPCPAYGVRISQPTIPHGALPSKSIRRTYFPWYVTYRPNGNLEVEESGTWDDLSRAHRDMVPGPSTPSAHPVKYGVPPYRFPGAVAIHGLGAVSDALVARQRWTEAQVIVDANDWAAALLKSDNTFQEKLRQWRKDAMGAAMRAWEITKRIERGTYGPTRSFFALNPTNQCDHAQIRWDKHPGPENAAGDEEEENAAEHYA